MPGVGVKLQHLPLNASQPHLPVRHHFSTHGAGGGKWARQGRGSAADTAVAVAVAAAAVAVAWAFVFLRKRSPRLPPQGGTEGQCVAAKMLPATNGWGRVSPASAAQAVVPQMISV